MACENTKEPKAASLDRPWLNSMRLLPKKVAENPGVSPVPECCFRAISQSVRVEEQDASPEVKTLAPAWPDPLFGRRLVRDSLGEPIRGSLTPVNESWNDRFCPVLPDNPFQSCYIARPAPILCCYRVRLSSLHRQKETQRRGRQCMRKSRPSAASVGFRLRSALTAAQNWRFANAPTTIPWPCSWRWLLAPSSAWRSRRQSGRPSLR